MSTKQDAFTASQDVIIDVTKRMLIHIKGQPSIPTATKQDIDSLIILISMYKDTKVLYGIEKVMNKFRDNIAPYNTDKINEEDDEWFRDNFETLFDCHKDSIPDFFMGIDIKQQTKKGAKSGLVDLGSKTVKQGVLYQVHECCL